MPYRDANPGNPNDTRNNAIRHILSIGPVASEDQAKAATDHTQGDDGTTNPDMKVAPDCAAF